MIAALLLIFAGYALIFGARATAERLIAAAIGIAIAIGVLPGLFHAAFGSLRAVDADAPGIGGLFLGAFGTIGVALLGYFAWHARSSLKRRDDERARRDSAPRERDVPPPPRGDRDGDE